MKPCPSRASEGSLLTSTGNRHRNAAALRGPCEHRGSAIGVRLDGGMKSFRDDELADPLLDHEIGNRGVVIEIGMRNDDGVDAPDTHCGESRTHDGSDNARR